MDSRRANLTSRPVLLFGARGNLGAALKRALIASGRDVGNIAWSDAVAWFTDADEQEQDRRIRAQITEFAGGDLDMVFAGGVTDPHRSREDLLLSNADFPRKVIAATSGLPGARYITCGTIMERLGGAEIENRYIASKLALADWVRVAASEGGDLSGRLIHLQLHTLYGGSKPTPHMFLGQLVDALRACRPFAMSAGTQLREYHHVDDIAGAMVRLMATAPWTMDAVLPLSSGNPVRLADLARRLFESADRAVDLQIGKLPMSETENLHQTFTPAPGWLLGHSREPLAGVQHWVDELLRVE